MYLCISVAGRYENVDFIPGNTTAGKGKEEGGKLTRSAFRYLVIMLEQLVR